MTIECFNYQTKKGHSCFANFKENEIREFILEANDDVSDVTKTLNSKIVSPWSCPFSVLINAYVPQSTVALKGEVEQTLSCLSTVPSDIHHMFIEHLL